MFEPIAQALDTIQSRTPLFAWLRDGIDAAGGERRPRNRDFHDPARAVSTDRRLEACDIPRSVCLRNRRRIRNDAIGDDVVRIDGQLDVVPASASWIQDDLNRLVVP